MSTQLNPEAIIDGSVTKEKLSEEVQTSLGKADTALQSYTEQYKGTVTGVKINGTTKNPSSGVVDLGTVITAHQTLKTINGESILGEGDLTVEGGAKVYTWSWDGESASVTLSQEEYDNIIEADIVVLNVGGIYHITVNKTGKEFSEALGGYNLIGRSDFQEISVLVNISIEISTKLATFTIEQQDIPTKTSQLENDSDFVSSDGLKTINGESIVGSGDIVIEGGGGSVEIPIIEHGENDTTITIESNTYHKWGEVSELTISLGEPANLGVVNEYMFSFVNTSLTPRLTIDELLWEHGEYPYFTFLAKNVVKIMDGFAKIETYALSEIYLSDEYYDDAEQEQAIYLYNILESGGYIPGTYYTNGAAIYLYIYMETEYEYISDRVISFNIPVADSFDAYISGYTENGRKFYFMSDGAAFLV